MELRKEISNYLQYQKDAYGELLYIDKTGLQEIAISESPVNSSQSHQIKNELSLEKPTVKTPIKETPIKVIQTIKPKEILLKNEPEWKKATSIEDLNARICNCLACSLGHTRKNFVFGTGNPNADIMVIGEAPGADEDEQGAPFVGRAGQLLTKILEAINLKRDEVFICNILKCRPPDNRRPLPSEMELCEPYLIHQIELIKPSFILALGLTAVDALLKKKNRMQDLRGQLFDYHNIKMLVTYHPAALLRNPGWKPLVWEDVKLLRKLYDEFLANK
jgi:uracil-DNA glycosylase